MMPTAIKAIYSQLISTHSEHSFYNTTVPESVENRIERIDELEEDFVGLVKRMVTSLTAYMEFKKLPLLLGKFENELGEYDNFNRSLLFKGDYHEESGEYASDFLILIARYIEPFEELQIETSDILRLPDFMILENILKGSKVLCNKLERPMTTETQISSVAKTIIEVVFPSVNFTTTQFISTAKCYKPDILIPYLHCAIEYKYAMDHTRLINTIDEIHTDVSGYNSDRSFKIFYAVFCVKAGIITDERFHTIWKDKNFPNNWRPILVQGF